VAGNDLAETNRVPGRTLASRPHRLWPKLAICRERVNGTSAWCDSVNPASVQTALAADGSAGTPGITAPNLSNLLGTTVRYGANGAPNFALPFKKTYNYSKVLPNTGISYNLDSHNLFYATYDQSFSAPKTDDLYVSSAAEAVKPETTTQYGLGYRYQGSTLTGSVNLWDTYWNNHIVQSYDPNDPTLSIDRNVGNVQLYGIDLEGAYRWTENFSVYASGTFMKSQLLQNYLVSVNGVSTPLPVKGKQLVMSPNQEFSVRGQYDWHDFSIGLQAKYESQRYLDDVNSTLLPGFTVFNMDAEYHFVVDNVKSTIQLNVYNILDAGYYSRATTAGNYTAVQTANGTYGASSGPFVYVGAPTTAYLTLKAQF
jgi:iron complex outermembrane receptor protein